jgi:hypothetical protein
MRTILKKPVRDQRDEALRLLGWLVYAKRPLKLHKVQTMKSINLKQRAVEFERRRFRVDPKDLCESLLDVRPDGSIELVHLTARVYVPNPLQMSNSARTHWETIAIFSKTMLLTLLQEIMDLQ